MLNGPEIVLYNILLILNKFFGPHISVDNNTTSKTSYGIPKHEVTVVII
jgi:hypothetical protein